MRAAFYERNGAARDVLHVADVDTPIPGPGEVRVRLKASGVNPSDVKAREGRTRKIAYPRVIPHSDGAGVIEMVGDGVPAQRQGERVWVWNAQWKRPHGTCAEYVVLPAQYAVPMPAHVSDEAGACLGIPAMTACNAVDVAGVTKGMTVLVTGGAGGVGHYAIQFAKARGATVLTTVSSDSKAELASKAGADHTIDYKRENVGERVAALTGKAMVDAVIEMDLAANARLYPGVLHARSSVVIYGTGSAEASIPAQALLVNGIRLQFIYVYELTAAERNSAVTGITRMLENKTLINNVAMTLPLNDIVAAHEAVEQGKAMGNVVVTL
ncbi:NADPH:quinone reductase [Rhodoplanes sp. Z2-YC6860]|uniref:NADPH:quinone reductase n=1 Tax=Rhodoplanes sp. Z2-YC6860 TaxID=674703 RepID=UPI00078CB6AD|nr:NADPH:quinone reductase [Rhodoplanes sp. Z2-YC6860]AMN42491.1 NADPH:quinone oxidoreductase [Rhodoplanes sp. Z2-YC6860]